MFDAFFTTYKRLLVLVSICGIVFLCIHISLVYMYDGGKWIGESGGSLSIGMIGKAPDIPNPLEYGISRENDMIMRFLFAGMIRWNPETKSYIGDIGTCSLQDISSISCTLDPTAKWSDGSSIKMTDVLLSFGAYKQSPGTKKIQKLYTDITYEGIDSTITFRNPNKNIDILDLLQYPIMRSDMIDRIKSGRLSSELYVTSGEYIFSDRVVDTQYGFTRISLERARSAKPSTYIEKYNFKFFDTLESLQKNTDSLHIILPKSPEISLSIPRFRPYTYHAYEYISLFLNSDRISKNLRQGIVVHTKDSLRRNYLDGKNDAYIEDIFFGTGGANSGMRISIEASMRALGYRKRSEYLAENTATPIILTGGINLPKNRYIQVPTTDSIYFSSGSTDTIMISGNIPANVEGVSINDYVLQEYRKGNGNFFYRAKQENGTLVDGKNIYTLTFLYASGRTVPVESLTIYTSTDTGTLATARIEIENSIAAGLNTPEQIAKRQSEIDARRIELEKLDPRFYYLPDGKRMTMRLLYSAQSPIMLEYANTLQTILIDIGLDVSLQSYSQNDLSDMIGKGKKDYDMIVVGIDAPDGISGLAQFFSPAEGEKGVNFGKIKTDTIAKKLSLLGTNTYDPVSIRKLQTDILSTISEESSMLPLASSSRSFYIDQNIQNIRNVDEIPNLDILAYIFESAYIKQIYVMEVQDKSLAGYISWLRTKVGI